MRIFITGGSGFLGSYLIPLLLRQGHTVVALARSTSSLAKVNTLGAIGVKGDITDMNNLTSNMKGCEVVIHAAAMLELWGSEQTFFEMNVTGTDHMLDAARAVGIKRFIQISAASVVGGGIPAYNIDESYTPPHVPGDFYSKTKLIAEQHVIAANSSSMTTVVLRPPLIWGKGQSMIETIKATVAHGRWVWIANGQHTISTIHIENLCAAIVASLERGRGGEIYFVTDGEMRSFRTFFTDWMHAEGIELSNGTIPRWLAVIMGQVMARIWVIFRLPGEPPITPAMVNMIGTEMSMIDRKARTELGYHNVISIDEALRLSRT